MSGDLGHRALEDDEPLVREHAAWALERAWGGIRSQIRQGRGEGLPSP